jgi:3-oxoacyl-[acyl-carrier protein] reductase
VSAANGTPAPAQGCAVVTGASRGIGAAIALELAQAGWPTIVNYRRDCDRAAETVRAIERGGGRALALAADVAEPAAAEQLIARAGEAMGPVLCLVNNAGVRADNLALSLSDEEWDSVIDTNLGAAFRLTRLALATMIRARFGRVISIASIVGPRANAGQANYAAAKAGLIGMTRTIAVEVARRGVTVNAVAPGFIETDMTRDLPGEALARVPARRAGRPQEVAACVRFLASGDADYITGSTIYVDGGMAA